MATLINRLAWGISFASGFVIIFLVGVLLDIDSDMLDSEAFLFWIILILLSAAIFKKAFLSKNLILRKLDVKVNLEKSEIEAVVDNVPPQAEQVSRPDATSIRQEIKSSPAVISQEIPLDADIEEEEVMEPEKREEIEKIEVPSSPGFFRKFFAENALAKIGGILLFLAVLFLLQLVYTVIGPIGKLMIGFVIGFIVFGVAIYFEKKGYENESRILMGTSILINYLVILSGRYLIGEEMFAHKTILNESMTFFLLAVNTIFAVSVSMAYRSQALLFFSFVIAYLNPFLINGRISLTFFSMLSYGLVVSLGAIILCNFYKEKYRSYSLNLLNISFLGGNIIILLSPFTTTTEWLIKLGALAILSLACIIMAYKNKFSNEIGGYFLGLYLFFILLIVYGNYALGNLFLGNEIFIGYILFMALAVLGGAVAFMTTLFANIFYIMLVPVFILPGLAYMNILYFGHISFIMIGIIFLYFMIFVKLFDKLNEIMKYCFFAVMGIFVLLFSFFVSRLLQLDLEMMGLINIQIYAIIFGVFLFLLFSYFFSGKKNMEYLYSVSTVFSILILLPLIQRSGDLKMISMASIAMLVLLNILAPFVNRGLLLGRVGNLVVGLLSGVLFAVGEMFYFWYGDADQSKMTIGFSVLLLAILYFFVGFLMHNVLGYYKEKQANEEGLAVSGDLTYVLLGISISLFSLAIAYIFSTHSEVISAIWLFEASLMFYFYQRSRDVKVYFFALALMMIGLIKMFVLMEAVAVREFIVLIPLLIIFASFAASLKFMDFEKSSLRFLHDAGHVVGMILIIMMLMNIIPDHRFGFVIFGLSIFAVLLSFVYSKIYSEKIQYVFAIFLIIMFFSQIFDLESFFRRADVADMPYLRIFQYLSTLLFGMVFVVIHYFQKLFNPDNINKDLARVVALAFSLYLFIITSQYIFYLFDENIFVLTIYWGVIAFGFLSFGIQKDLIKLRTIGLYILSLTTIKILLYDIWSGLNDAILRVVALMLVGGVMIAISILYSRKYRGDLKGEFSLENFKK
jgi:MFS family permease